MNDIVYQRGFPAELRLQAANLYDSAFGQKLSVAIPNKALRITLLSEGMIPDHSFVAREGSRLLGIAGFKTQKNALTGGISAGLLYKTLGLLGFMRAVPILVLYDRPFRTGQLLLDGLAVDQSARGRGIGSQLLNSVKEFARQENYASIRLDVIDTNPNAKRLYERMGFLATGETKLPYLKRILGFGGATTMEMSVESGV